MKTLAIIGIVICGIGIFGGLILLEEEFSTGILALLVYGYFLTFSILTLKKGRTDK